MSIGKLFRNGWIIGGLAVLLIGGGVFALSSGSSTDAVSAAQTDDITTVFVGNLAAGVTASGQVSAQRRASLSVNSSSRVEGVMVRVGDEVAAGDVLITLNNDQELLDVASAEQTLQLRETELAELIATPDAADIASAEAAVASARADLDDLMDGPTAESIAEAEASIRAAEASVWSASVNLQSTQDTITQADIEAAKAELVNAEYQLEQAQDTNDRIAVKATHDNLVAAQEAVDVARAKYNDLLNGVSVYDVAASQADVASAAADVENNQASLDQLLVDPTAAQIAAAESQLKQAESNLATLLEDASAAEIRSAEAATEQAKLSLADAEEALADTRIRAPFDGIVTAVNVSEGELAAGMVVELLDPQSFEVVLGVDELDIGQISVGQPVNLTMESWPNDEINGEVRTIAPSATESGGLITYDVHILLNESDLPVRVGMTADADLITSQREGILLVDNAAIKADRSTGTYSVNLIEDDTVTEVDVQIGLRDADFTQILSGVDDGDVLAIDYEAPTASITGPGPFGGD